MCLMNLQTRSNLRYRLNLMNPMFRLNHWHLMCLMNLQTRLNLNFRLNLMFRSNLMFLMNPYFRLSLHFRSNLMNPKYLKSH
jgi:hypothetical protein